MPPGETSKPKETVSLRALIDEHSTGTLDAAASLAKADVDSSSLDRAHSKAYLGQVLPGRRPSLAKRAFLRVVRRVTKQQSDFNLAVVEAIKVGSANAERRMAEHKVLAMEVREQLHRFLEFAKTATSSFEEAERRLRFDRTELARLRTLLNSFMEEAKRRLPEPFDQQALESFSLPLEEALDSWYDEFESVFRGSREEIRDRQREYLEDVRGVRASGAWVDVGCGRGEWLELLKGEDIKAYGVDSNTRFVELCKLQSLDVVEGDAIEHLRRLPDDSIAGLTAFHLLEHLPFSFLVSLLDEALRVLRPGGLLIVETPNPTNIIVGSSSFYLDPTHKNPLHPQLTEFLVKARGFGKVELRFLHPSKGQPFSIPDPKDEDWAAVSRVVEYLNGALFGALDYAVLGTKGKHADG